MHQKIETEEANQKKDLSTYMVISWATLAWFFTNLQKTSTVKFKAFSFSCRRKTLHLINFLKQQYITKNNFYNIHLVTFSELDDRNSSQYLLKSNSSSCLSLIMKKIIHHTSVIWHIGKWHPSVYWKHVLINLDTCMWCKIQ